MNLDEKKAIVEDMQQRFSSSKVVILTNYKGLDVKTLNMLRQNLKEADVEYKVVKNTLMVRASENTGVALIKDNFKGPGAVAISYKDPVTPAKILTEFAKDNPKLEIKIGVLDGKSLDLKAIESLASLPSREILLSQLLNVMNGVPTAFVRALNDVPCRLVNVLQAVKDTKETA